MPDHEMPDDQEIQSERAPDDDFFLRVLLRVLNQTGIEIGVTLTVKGVLVTGVATGWQQYFEGNAEQIRGAGRGKDNQATFDAVASAFDSVIEVQRELESQTPELNREPHFIHLKNAKFFVGSNLVPNTGTWWRGRISEIDGFTVGNLDV